MNKLDFSSDVRNYKHNLNNENVNVHSHDNKLLIASTGTSVSGSKDPNKLLEESSARANNINSTGNITNLDNQSVADNDETKSNDGDSKSEQDKDFFFNDILDFLKKNIIGIFTIMMVVREILVRILLLLVH